MASWGTYLQAFAYIVLLFFFIPIRIDGPTELETQFEEYLKKFNKTYHNAEQYQSRLKAFEKTLATIEALNSNRTNHSAHYGLTKYSDMLPDEFLQHHLQVNLSQRILRRNFQTQRTKRAITDLPEKVDWREKKVVSKIKNQGSCGACWAFSAVETVESMQAIKTGKLEELSVQEMIDCAGYGNDGCGGGDVCNLLWWMADTQVKLERESDYPLNFENTQCKMNTSSYGVQVEDFACENFTGTEDFMLELLARNGPLAVAINAQTWQNYIGGVIEFHCDSNYTMLNHAVQIVGYDLTAPIPYYIVRNTWGEDFGDRGYLYIATGRNLCGLANEVSALTVL